MKNTSLILIAIVLILVLGGGMTLPSIDLGELSGWFGGDRDVDDGKVVVDKRLTVVLMNKFAGAVIGGTPSIDIYDSDGFTPIETLTIGSGTADSALPYESGRLLYFRYEATHDKMWWKLTVPKQNPQDAEALTRNSIQLNAFINGTYTSDTLIHGATSIADAGEYNFTTSGNVMSFTYSLANSGADNTGLISSYDPVYDMKWGPVVYVTFSGTNYETVLVYGFDYDYTLGTTHYVASDADPYDLTIHKKANMFLSAGTWDITFTLDGTGYSGAGTTMQINVYMYSDANYAMNHGGSYGPEALLLAEHTVTLKTA